jgi:hypothetical protein
MMEVTVKTPNEFGWPHICKVTPEPVLEVTTEGWPEPDGPWHWTCHSCGATGGRHLGAIPAESSGPYFEAFKKLMEQVG